MASKLNERIKYAMNHLSPKQHISLLAQPNWRRTQWKNSNALAKPFSVSRAALTAKATKRIKVMARPKYVNKKYDPTTLPPYGHSGINPKTLEGKANKRITDLALPKKRLMISNMRLFPYASANLAETLWKVQNSRYRRYRFFCNARKQREMRKRQRKMAKFRRVVKPDQWNRLLQALSKLAVPKEYPRPRFPFKRKPWRPVNMRRIDDLAMPVAREMPPPRDPFKVPPKALTFKTTERLNLISKPKTIEEPMFRIPGVVSPAALKAIASPRTINLAKPAERPEGIETDLRKDAFTVSPLALKAKCSKRLKFLAKPKRR